MEGSVFFIGFGATGLGAGLLLSRESNKGSVWQNECREAKQQKMKSKYFVIAGRKNTSQTIKKIKTPLQNPGEFLTAEN